MRAYLYVGQTARWRSTASDEHIFPAIVCKRLPYEAAIERFHLETGDVEEPEPLVSCCPPEGTLRAIGERHVDPIVAHGIPDGIGYRLFLRNAIETGGNLVVKGEGIPGEAPVRPERRRHPLEGSAAVGPGRSMQERAKRAVDERRRFSEREVPHVARDQFEFHASFRCPPASLV